MQHYYNTDIAKCYGITAAVVAQNFWYWVRQNERASKNLHEGRWWVYESVREMGEIFYYLTPNQIRKSIEKLVLEGILLKGNFNKTKYDRTTWYTFTNEGYAIFAKIEMEIIKRNKEIA